MTNILTFVPGLFHSRPVVLRVATNDCWALTSTLRSRAGGRAGTAVDVASRCFLRE